MTDSRWLFIGKDERMGLSSSFFSERGIVSRHLATDEGGEHLEQQIIEFAPTHIVFPILQLKGTVSPHLLNEGTRLFTGVASKQWVEPFENEGFEVLSYLHEERFIWQNAVLTAEAFIHEYYTRAKRSMAGSKFHVAGFGKVGKTVAVALRSLGAHVTVVARSDSQIGEAEALGFSSQRLVSDFKAEQSCLVNSIPAQWLSVQDNPTFHIFDLASSPGCLKTPLSTEYYTILLGLPGKHFPIDAATALVDTLERM